MYLLGSSAHADTGMSHSSRADSHGRRSMMSFGTDLTLHRCAVQRPLKVPRRHPVVFCRAASRLDFQQPAPKGDRDSVRAVVGAELVDQVLDVEVDRRFGNPEFAGDLLVSMAVAD